MMFKTFSDMDEKNQARARILFAESGPDDGFLYGLDLDGVVFYRRPAAEGSIWTQKQDAEKRPGRRAADRAYQDLLARLQAGIEFPDAAAGAAVKFRVSVDELRRMYDEDER